MFEQFLKDKKKDSEKSVVKWFDVNNDHHIQAYHYLQRHGHWPKDFIPDYVVIPSTWAFEIDCKLANAYVQEKMKNLTPLD